MDTGHIFDLALGISQRELEKKTLKEKGEINFKRFRGEGELSVGIEPPWWDLISFEVVRD